MTDFNAALDAFLASVNEDMEKDYERFENLTFGDGPDDDTNGVYVHGGRKYVKIAHKRGSQTMVYCFVSTVDVPNKNVKAGDILMAAGWAAPALNRKVPAAGNIFDPTTYENKNKAYGGWLYA